MPGLPTGTITFLFTDIESSTRLWDEQPEQMRQALARHDTVVRRTFEDRGGAIFTALGDAFCAAFPTARDALEAALAAQQEVRRLSTDPDTGPPLRVRMALHAGAAEERDGTYFGPVLNRCARLLSLGSGGQVLVSRAVQELALDQLPPDISLRDLGTHALRDLRRPEQVFQLVHPDLPDGFPPLRSLAALPTNLPAQLSSFVGRAREVGDLRERLAEARIVTLTGAGGSGKTRLALEVGADLLPRYPDGVWLVELAPLSDPALLPAALAEALSLQQPAGGSLLQTIKEHLKSRNLLLLLDNCEHLLESCATLAEDLLRSCPGLKVLATSRTPLRIPGELNYRVPTLSVPHRPGSPGDLLRYEAVGLFVERARLHQPSFALTEANAAAVATISRRLDGIPLALELAAARVKTLSVQQIADRLSNRFRLLTGGTRSAGARQQTLRAAIDWSYDLLSEEERAMLRRISVFAAGFTLEAAEAVSGSDETAPENPLDLLSQLVDHSLVNLEAGESSGEDEGRYRLLETIREYGQDRLREAGEEEPVVSRFLDWALDLVEAAEQMLRGPRQSDWLDRLETEHDNLRAALDRCLSAPAGGLQAVQMSAALWRFWYIRGYLGEGRSWLQAALEQAGPVPPEVRAKALGSLGNIAWAQGDFEAAARFHEESLEIRRSLGDRVGTRFSLNNLGIVASKSGDLEAARGYFEEGLRIGRELGDPTAICTSLINLGNLHRHLGSLPLARQLLQEAVDLQRQIGDEASLAAALGGFGAVVRLSGDLPAALELFQESLRIRSALRDRTEVIPILMSIASVAADCGDHCTATWLLGAASGLTHAVGFTPVKSDEESNEEMMQRLRTGLGPARFQQIFEEGQNAPLERVVPRALAYAAPD